MIPERRRPGALVFDQAPVFDISDPDPVPDFDFDQSVPEWPEPEG